LKHWHRCERWLRKNLPCPLQGELDHEDDNDDGEKKAFTGARPRVAARPKPSRQAAKVVIGRHAMRAPSLPVLERSPMAFIKMLQEMPRIERPVVEKFDRGFGGGVRQVPP